MSEATQSVVSANSSASLYEIDFHAWTQEQAELLREGRLSQLDREHIAEEIESLGKQQRQELENRFGILLGGSSNQVIKAKTGERRFENNAVRSNDLFSKIPASSLTFPTRSQRATRVV